MTIKECDDCGEATETLYCGLCEGCSVSSAEKLHEQNFHSYHSGDASNYVYEINLCRGNK